MKWHKALDLTGRPSVSVVIPHFNYGQYLPFAVKSALDHEGLDIEVIIVDDTSTDGSLAVAQRLAAQDERVHLVAHAENMRHIATYNDGLSRATGTYVVLLSADDALTPNSLTRAISLMEHHPNVGLVYGSVDWFAGDPPAFTSRPSWWQTWSGPSWADKVGRRGRNIIANPEVVMRRSVLEATGGYDPLFPHAADLYMWLHAASLADIGFVGGPAQGQYRTHEQNMHSVQFGGLLDDMTEVASVFQRFYATDGKHLPRAEQSLARALHSVARESLLRGLLMSSSSPSSDPGALASFKEFAVATSPDIVRTPVWTWVSTASKDDSRLKIAATSERLRWRIRSRRADLVGL